MAKQDKDNSNKSLRNSNRSFSNVSLNDDNARMRANFEANPFNFLNGNGALLKEQVVGEDGQVYESKAEAEESEIEHERVENFNTAWSTAVGDMLEDSIAYGYGNDEEDFEVLADWEEAIDDPYDSILMQRYGQQDPDFMGPLEVSTEYDFMGPMKLGDDLWFMETPEQESEAKANTDGALIDQPENNAVTEPEDIGLLDPAQQTEATLEKMGADAETDMAAEEPAATQSAANNASFGSTDPSGIETNIDPKTDFAAAAAPVQAKPAAPEIAAEAANDASFEEEPAATTPQAAPAPAFG